MIEKKKEPEQVQESEPLTEEQEAKQALEQRVVKFREKHLEINPTLPEAGGIAFITVYWNGIPINVTGRASNPYDAMATLIAGVSLAKSALGITLEKQATAQAPEKKDFGPSPFEAPASSPTPVVAQASFGPPASTPVVPATTDKQVQSFNAVKMEVVPQANDRVQIKWFAANHKFPDLYSNMPIQMAVEQLAAVAPWEDKHFRVANVFDVNYIVEWQNSDKLNSKGNPYKNLVRVSLSAE